MITPAPWIESIPSYSPGRSKEEIARDYGIEKPIKLASNENPLGPSPKSIEAVKRALSEMHTYPDATAADLIAEAARHFDCPASSIIAGNGSDEILDMICRTFLVPGDRVIIPSCSFSYYKIAAQVCGASAIETEMTDHTICVDAILNQAKPKLIFIANPNNPTGTYLNSAQIQKLLDGSSSETIIVIDEAYGAFCRKDDFSSALPLISRYPNLIVVKTLSKSHGMAGLRVGFGMACTGLIQMLYRIKPPFNINKLGLVAGEAALTDEEYYQRTLQTNWDGLDYLYRELTRLNLEYVESQTNFVLVKIGPRAQAIYEELLKRGIITRFGAGNGLDEHLRVSVGLPRENQAFIEALAEII